MDSARFLDSVRDPYARRQAPSMALSGSLASGQSYYTVESLEGSSSLPPLKSGFGAPAPLSSDRDVLLGLDARTRALIADREAVDARARLLAAEREALLRRNMPGAPLTERRAFADELAPVGSRPRFDGIRPLDDLQSVDPRARGLGLDMRSPQDALRRGIDDRARALAPLSGLAPEHRSEMIRARELAAVGRSSVAPFLPPSDYLPVRRDIADVRTPILPPNPPFSRRDFSNRSTSTFPRTERSARTVKQAPAAPRPAPSEAARKKTTVATNVKTPSAQPKTKQLSKESESEGWCAVCKIDCFNIKNLTSHVSGKKHKAVAEEKLGKPKGQSDEGKPTSAATSHVEKKRAGDVKPEALRAAKRPKTSEPALGNGVPVKAPDAKDGKMNDPKKEKAKATVAIKKDGRDILSCEVCNIFTTGQLNLEAHLKGKRHAARVKELADSQVAK